MAFKNHYSRSRGPREAQKPESKRAARDKTVIFKSKKKKTNRGFLYFKEELYLENVYKCINSALKK